MHPSSGAGFGIELVRGRAVALNPLNPSLSLGRRRSYNIFQVLMQVQVSNQVQGCQSVARIDSFCTNVLPKEFECRPTGCNIQQPAPGWGLAPPRSFGNAPTAQTTRSTRFDRRLALRVDGPPRQFASHGQAVCTLAQRLLPYTLWWRDLQIPRHVLTLSTQSRSACSSTRTLITGGPVSGKVAAMAVVPLGWLPPRHKSV